MIEMIIDIVLFWVLGFAVMCAFMVLLWVIMIIAMAFKFIGEELKNEKEVK